MSAEGACGPLPIGGLLRKTRPTSRQRNCAATGTEGRVVLQSVFVLLQAIVSGLSPTDNRSFPIGHRLAVKLDSLLP
jgi:hypothetical protein